MKKLLLIICASVLYTVSVPSLAAPVKKVCHTKTIKGKDTKICKDIKVHKKLKGTKVPAKK